MKRLATACGAALSAMLLAGCSTPRGPEGAASGVSEIRFGTDASYPPFEYQQAKGRLGGFDIELGQAICAHLRAKCVWVEEDFDAMIPSLQAGKFDAILSSMYVSKPRLAQIDFSEKIYSPPSRLVARASAGFKLADADLAGKKIGVEQGTLQERYAKAHWQKNGVQVESYQEGALYAALAKGELDAVFQDVVSADYKLLRTSQGKGFAFVEGQVGTAGADAGWAAIGLRKGDAALKAAINKALAQIIEDGTYQQLEDKYFYYSIY
ncbi:transporter substrate-binding domain-containing protein [uncultured Aquitalea sp.]|uniref:transporter substrate-binding domain-containing protein n=1 Tax=uncultured Aquitalea sp. TaxID=540272 RepID=UPI0025DC976E|nr:transporter substrate-binding domain-containing protein [uncultured Aquitalea sp.]